MTQSKNQPGQVAKVDRLCRICGAALVGRRSQVETCTPKCRKAWSRALARLPQAKASACLKPPFVGESAAFLHSPKARNNRSDPFDLEFFQADAGYIRVTRWRSEDIVYVELPIQPQNGDAELSPNAALILADMLRAAVAHAARRQAA